LKGEKEMNKLFCDRCGIEITKKEQQEMIIGSKIEYLWTSEEHKENDKWDLCKNCAKQLLEFLSKK